MPVGDGQLKKAGDILSGRVATTNKAVKDATMGTPKKTSTPKKIPIPKAATPPKPKPKPRVTGTDSKGKPNSFGLTSRPAMTKKKV